MKTKPYLLAIILTSIAYISAAQSVSFRTSLFAGNASDSSYTLADACIASYNNNYCACVDASDASKLTNVNESLALLRNGYLLTIEARPLITTYDTLFLNLIHEQNSLYKFAFSAKNMGSQGLNCFLKDSYLGDSSAISLAGDTTNYIFNITGDIASKDPNRFMILFSPGITPVSSVKDGNWSDPSIWSTGKIPDANSSVTITTAVTVDINTTVYSIHLNNDQLLTVSPGVNLVVTGK